MNDEPKTDEAQKELEAILKRRHEALAKYDMSTVNATIMQECRLARKTTKDVIGKCLTKIQGRLIVEIKRNEKPENNTKN